MGNSSGRGVLEGAFSLLEALKTAEEAGLTSLASGSGLPKSTTHRLLEQLVEIGAVERSAGSYRMGPRMFRLGQAWQPCPGLLLAKVREPIRRLACATGTTVGVCVLSEGRTLLVASVPGGVEELASMRPGSTCPWPTAAGKVLVAGVNPQIPLGPLPPGWPQEAAEIRDRGIAFDRQEQLAGVCCTAVPLRGSAGQTVAALCVLTNPARQVPQLAEAVTRAGRIISRQLRR
jgi:IclR family acetate operon transcriptional repressor